MTDKDWDFIPSQTFSFDSSSIDTLDIFVFNENYGIKLKQSNFNLDLKRDTYPKSLSLNAKSDYLELFYITGDYHAYSISYKNQIADTQRIRCYTLGSLTIGSCEDASINISNSNPKYNRLNDGEIFLIDGNSSDVRINSIYALDNNYVDELTIYLSQSTSKFDWLSPIETLTTGFISNLTYGGETIKNIVSNGLKNMPQKERFLINKLGFNIKNEYQLNQYSSYFYDLDFLYLNFDGYKAYQSVKNYNYKFTSGIKFYLYENLSLSLSGTIYKHNLLGFEDITFNQRSEHHFDKEFGLLNINLRYFF